MRTIEFIPGNIVTPNAITIPTTVPDIETVVSAVIQRLPLAVAAHSNSAVPAAHTDTGTDPAHAALAVDAHADHAHDFATIGLGVGVGVALGFDAIAATQVEDAGGVALHILAGGLGTGIQDFTMPVHVVNPQPNDHAAADIAAAVDDHTQAEIAAALADHLGGDPIVAGGPYTVTRLTTRTISLDTTTLEGDLLTLDYLEVGERVLVS